MRLTAFALLSVVFLDIMSQGLVIPILNTVIMEPSQPFLPTGTSVNSRQFDFGLVMGIFFLCWFLGAAYISKLSDSIGRKEGILVCLVGNLIGYGLTILALEVNSFWLLCVARGISGFTAGNQPIAQAALVDMSENDQQKTRFMGLVLAALSLGLVAGPLIGGVLSDKALIGDLASVELPFYFVSLLVVLNILLIWFCFHNRSCEKEAFRFKPWEAFLTLYQAARHKTVLRISIVFFWSQLALNSFFVFLDTYLFRRFQFDTLENSFALIVLGAAMGLASAFLVPIVMKRLGSLTIVCGSLLIMMASAAAFVVNGSPVVAYLLIVPFMVAFALNYPTMLTLFSLAVDERQQGWVMGVTVALFTLGAGIISVIGGRLMAVSIHLPFMISVGSLVIALLLILLFWRTKDMRDLLMRSAHNT
ncbi:MAG: MFS transporter [Pseudomonadota bacterium]